MKRYLVLFFVLILLIPCMTVTASATTQGIIDAIDDLAAGLGTSQGDIVDLLTSIDEWIYEAVVQLQDISTTLYSSIYEGYCVPVFDYFFTKDHTGQSMFTLTSILISLVLQSSQMTVSDSMNWRIVYY